MRQEWQGLALAALGHEQITRPNLVLVSFPEDSEGESTRELLERAREHDNGVAIGSRTDSADADHAVALRPLEHPRTGAPGATSATPTSRCSSPTGSPRTATSPCSS
jgi:hypothetical protein